jgi:uncharacterized protein YjeT (DUF2065 family)
MPLPVLNAARLSPDNRLVVVGLVLVVLGMITAAFPRPFVAVAPFYRVSMPERATPQSVRAARLGGLLVMVSGVAVLLLT